jgi:hypothetical protein
MTELYCETCNYKTTRPSEWQRHIQSQKHARKGAKKDTLAVITKCTQCDYESAYCWNVKLHQLNKHTNDEEKAKHKYYCSDCDVICICNTHFIKHNNSKRHIKKILDNQPPLTDSVNK